MSNMKKRQLVQREMERAATASKKRAGLQKYHAISERPIYLSWLQLREEIPTDTRCLTARMLGDPLPGRSALDRKHLDRET